MSDGGRGRASLGVEGWKSSQKWSVQRSDVRSSAWLDGFRPSPEHRQQSENYEQRESDDERSLCDLQEVPRKPRQRNVRDYLMDLWVMEAMLRVDYCRVLARQEEIRDGGLDC